MGVSELAVFVLRLKCDGHATHARQDVRLSPLCSHTKAALPPLRSQAVTARTRTHNTRHNECTSRLEEASCVVLVPPLLLLRRRKFPMQIFKLFISDFYLQKHSTMALLTFCRYHQWNNNIHSQNHLVWTWWSSLFNRIPSRRFRDLCQSASLKQNISLDCLTTKLRQGIQIATLTGLTTNNLKMLIDNWLRNCVKKIEWNFLCLCVN